MYGASYRDDTPSLYDAQCARMAQLIGMPPQGRLEEEQHCLAVATEEREEALAARGEAAAKLAVLHEKNACLRVSSHGSCSRGGGYFWMEYWRQKDTCML